MSTCAFGCEIDELVYEGERSRIYLARRSSDGLPVVVKTTRSQPAPPERQRALSREYELLRSLQGLAGVPEVYALERDGGDWGLIMARMRGRSLAERKLAGLLDLPSFVELSLQVVALLGELHRRHVVHKDLTPANLILRESPASLHVIDFASATLFGHEPRPCVGSDGVEGSLAYVSPEQTGRTSRAVDYRSDYYSLGVTLFELLTGALPFNQRDPLELMHAHVARQPPDPQQLRPGVPDALARIVLKLLEKDPEARYQSLAGLRLDLEFCRERLAAGASTFSLVHAHADRPEGFRIPRRLYARKAEIQQLTAAFANACRGRTTWVAVEGGAGVGKTSLVRELVEPVAASRGYYLAAKFEQYDTATPYAAFRQLIDALVRQALTEPTRELAAWRERILGTAASACPSLVELCPSLELVIGAQPPALPLAAAESRTRLRQAVFALFSALSSSGRPTCVILDDLQRADADTWFLLEELTTIHDSSLLFVLVFRDDERPERDNVLPPRAAVEQLARAGTEIAWLRVDPLPLPALAVLIGDSVPVQPENLAPIANLVHARTGGNPFFVRAFLRSLEEDTREREHPSDTWTLERVERTPPTDNIIQLLVQQVSKLPERTQRILKVAACAGSSFEASLLASVGESTALEDLMPAILGSFVIPADSVAAPRESGGPTFMRAKFAHDRVQQALLTMLEPSERMQIHRELADALRAEGSSELSEAWFQMIGHMNNAVPLLERPALRVQLAEWNLKAARAALSRAAAAEALAFARAGVDALGDQDNAWSNLGELTSRLHVVAAEAALVSGDREAFKSFVAATIDHTAHVLDVVAVRGFEGELHYANFQLNTAAETYLDALARLGLELPRNPTPVEIDEALRETAHALAGRSAAALLELPRCEDPKHVATMRVLSKLTMVAGSATSSLLPVAACRLVQHSLVHGNTTESAIGYTLYGRILSEADHDVELACSFGRLALELADRFGDRGVLAQIHLYANYQLMHWITPLSDLTPSFRLALGYGMEACTPFNTAGSAATLCICRFWSGHALSELARETEQCSEVVRRCHQPLVQNWIDIWTQVVINLRSEAVDFETLRGPAYDEAKRLPMHLEANDPSALFNYYTAKALLHYLARQPEAAARAIDDNEAFWAVLGRDILAIPFTFFAALCDLGACESAAPERKARLLERARSAERKLSKWCPHNPTTIRVKLAILRAELGRVEAASAAPLQPYVEAVQVAEREGSAFERAIANENAARVHEAQGDGAASGYLRAAHRHYLHWGANAKAIALEREYPGLMQRESGIQPQLNELLRGAGGLDLVDLLSVLHAARAISGEIKLERLLQRLMRLLIESSGAQSGYLILPRDGEWLVECGRSAEHGNLTLLESLPFDRAESKLGISTAIVNFVARSGETVLLDDAAREGPYTTDPDIARNAVRSVLCFSLQRGREALAVVYLENNLVRGAFTPNRRNMLELLSTQAVVALENARLYDSLERKVEERTTELHSKNNQLADALQRMTEMQQQLVVQEKLAALGSLTASIAHEIKNPLNFVTNFAELSAEMARELGEQLSPSRPLANGAGTQATQELLHDLIRNVEKVREHGLRANDIVANMALHSRDSRALPEHTDLHRLLHQSYTGARQARLPSQAVREPKLTTRFAAPTDIEIIVQDIERVFTNLAMNARYAMQQKALRAGNDYVPELVITTRDRGDSVEVSFRDNGTGIPDSMLDKVFVPFFTTKPAGEGTGLGLSICHDIIVRGHSGSLRVESVEGEYAELILSLPKRFRRSR